MYSLAEQVDEWPGDYSDAAAGLDFAAVFRDAVRVPLDPSVRFPAPPWVSVAPVGTPPGSPGWRVLGYLDPDSIRFSDFREAMDNVGELVTRTVRGFTVQFRAVGDRVRTMIESIMPVDRHVPRPQPPADAGHTGPATTPFRHHGTKAVYPRRETRRATRTRRRTHARH